MTTTNTLVPEPVQRLVAAVQQLLAAREHAMLTAAEWDELQDALAACEAHQREHAAE